jgi:hypothetical protein
MTAKLTKFAETEEEMKAALLRMFYGHPKE